jgi:hypothetical protein
MGRDKRISHNRWVWVWAVAAAECLGLSGGRAAWGAQYRSLDGSGNNQTRADWGMVGQDLLRVAGVNYQDGVESVDPGRPNPRDVSNAIFTQLASVPDARGLSEWVWVWGQFIDHDIDHTLIDPASGTLSVTIPHDDPWFAPHGLGGESIDVTRSHYDPATGAGTGHPRRQVNNISAWLDAGMVYGGRAVDAGADRAVWLRSGSGGRLKVSDGGALGDLLPRTEPGAPVMANQSIPTMGADTFVAGDVRANEHTALTAVHTLWVREHNRLAGIIAASDPLLGDEQIYQRARKIVAAEIQSITFNGFLPALGITLDPYAGYDDTVDPTVANEFSAAGYRLGHSQINGTMLRLNPDETTITEGNLRLADAFFNPSRILQGGLEPLFLGLAAQVQESTDAKMVDGLRNQLFLRFVPGQDPDSPGQLVANATDLASVNITRGRDHGLPFYNDARSAYGLVPASDFSQITSDTALQAALASVYSDVGQVDLWVGMLAEDHLPGSSVGALVHAILVDQFARLRDGDRFWYPNDAQPGGINDDLLAVAQWNGSEPMSALDWLDTLRLSDVIKLNTGVAHLQDNVFFAYAIPEPASILALSVGLGWPGMTRRCRSRRRA